MSRAVGVPPEVQLVTWYNNGRQLEPSDKYRLKDEGGGVLTLQVTPLELGDDGEWKVVVKNEGGFATSTCKLTLTGNPAPLPPTPLNERCLKISTGTW